jgi:predicted esterase
VRTVFVQGIGTTRVQALAFANAVRTLVPASSEDDDSDEMGAGAGAEEGARDPEEVRAVNKRPLHTPLLFNILPGPELDEITYLSVPTEIHGEERHHESSYDHASGQRSAQRRKKLHYSINWLNTSLAGARLVQTVSDQIRRAITETAPPVKIVVFGMSRGASAALAAVAQLRGDDASRIGLVIADAPFDSVSGLVARRAGCLAPVAAAVVNALRAALTPENPWVERDPIDYLEEFPVCVPVLVFSGALDATCPQEAQEAVVARLRARGVHTRHCVLPRSAHNDHPHGPDQRAYRAALRESYALMFDDKDECE